ncbi:helix-turn-helix transcriptional regulator [Azospirillum sp. RWY-5-1]|uniref:Helix-turn-helix transcriptional regulator n=2 Tax=Azospirillum oleiclasticum TaxID=2735135 RepID=A0ABX2TAH2_9PROT|nr:helix-turn-helix transcriptional regulator [Azospirillum oleiclasticum]NYZ21174.1 helix-turn-helix transcriptional regulator [Azospirillum oleiclasticum]
MHRGGGRHGFGHGHGHHHDEGGRGGRRRAFEGGELQLVLLKLLAEQPRHGYDLIRAIEERTGGAYAPSPGVVYPMLSMLEELGQIEKAGDEGTRKAFTATTDGIARLDAEKDVVEAVLAKLGALAARRERTDGAPIRRAMDNLRAVLMHRLGREGVEADTIHAAAAILDEAAQRIERLP